MRMQTLTFRESKEFFKLLDDQVKSGGAVIVFDAERPSSRSQLWPRLRRCQNWNEIETELDRIRQGHESRLNAVLSSQFQAALTGGEILLAAWIATLVAGIVLYAIYKNRKVKLSVGRDGNGEIIIT